jgi:hypothetical protein
MILKIKINNYEIYNIKLLKLINFIIYVIFNNNNIKINIIFILGIGDWGLGIGDWAQSPIPNPQSPNPQLIYLKIKFYLNYNL